jgi:hypothetical protein
LIVLIIVLVLLFGGGRFWGAAPQQRLAGTALLSAVTCPSVGFVFQPTELG